MKVSTDYPLSRHTGNVLSPFNHDGSIICHILITKEKTPSAFSTEGEFDVHKAILSHQTVIDNAYGVQWSQHKTGKRRICEHLFR